MISSIEDFYSQAKSIISEFDNHCLDLKIIRKSSADHFGLRCSSSEIYEKTLKIFTFESTFTYQSIISGRRIAIIGLKKPIKTSLGELRFLELSDQKQDRSQIDQFDHFEIIPNDYSSLVENLIKNGTKLKENIKPHHSTYDIIFPNLTIKLTREALIEKIKRDEMI